MRPLKSAFLAATVLVLLVAGCGSARKQPALAPSVPRHMGPYKLELVKAPAAALDGIGAELLSGAYVLRIGSSRSEKPMQV